ncbi:MAG TPA: nucleoside transporter C-terminal domain-containing protein, partial [Pirellulales bacterium]|nr:nucleoside transporter C-terminal domain-containing protein [Pirellulales bacterium]
MGADEVAILATSVMAAPCGLYLSKLMLPETELPETHGRAQIASEKLHGNAIDAAAAGASDGMYLALNVAAMLIAFLAFIALVNAVIGGIKPTLLTCGFPPGMLAEWPDNLSLATIFSWVFAPFAFLIGAGAQDIGPIADLLGTKLVANEFVAYVKLTTPAAEQGYHDVISPRGYALATYALTGFANFASIGIQLGGIGSLAPKRRPDLAALGGRALLCGFLATLINAAIAGIMMSG